MDMSDEDSGGSLPVKTEVIEVDVALRGELEQVLAEAGLPGIPDIVDRARASRAYVDYFIAEYDNPHTRRAYKRQVDKFLSWCDERAVELHEITPSMCGQFRDQVRGSAASKKQMLAALRGFFDMLVERHFCLLNPARSTRNPREHVEQGKTPEIPGKEVERLLRNIDASHIVGKRDRAIIAAWAATGVRIGAVAKLRLRNLYYHDGQWFLELDEKNSKHREVPVRHDLQKFILDYMQAAQLTGAPEEEHLFRTVAGRTKKLRGYEPERYAPDGTFLEEARGAMRADDMRKMLKRRLTDADFGTKETRTSAGGHKYTHHQSRYSPHSFRVMVVTDLLEQGNDIHDVAYLVGHSSTRTTQGYDRSRRKVKRNLVERIRINMPE